MQQAKTFPERNTLCCPACEENDITVFDGVRMPLKRSAALIKWDFAGEVLVPGVLNPGDINKTDGCKKSCRARRKNMILKGELK